MSKRSLPIIELLVVTSVCAVIAAVAVPIFKGTNQASGKTNSLDNWKKLTSAVTMYAQDHDGALPPSEDYAHVRWTDLVAPYVRKNDGTTFLPNPVGAVSSYGVNQLIFVDDVDYRPGDAPSASTLTAVAAPDGTVMIGELGTEADMKTPRPNAFKLVAPDDKINDPFDALPASRGSNQYTVALFDGHVKSLQAGQFYVSQTPPDKWFCLDATDPGKCKSSD